MQSQLSDFHCAVQLLLLVVVDTTIPLSTTILALDASGITGAVVRSSIGPEDSVSIWKVGILMRYWGKHDARAKPIYTIAYNNTCTTVAYIKWRKQ